MKTVRLIALSCLFAYLVSHQRCTELTFIVCHRESETTEVGSEDPPLTMIGDINLFLKGSPNEEDFEVEVEIMIAG